jgi:hypothetical protein
MVGNCEVVVKAASHYRQLYSNLFSHHLEDDAVYLLVASGVIAAVIWLYSGSLLLTVATAALIAFSLLAAYFLYTVVFDLPFFPFLNVIAVVVLVGICADDVFVILDVWRETEKKIAASWEPKVASNQIKGQPQSESLKGLSGIHLSPTGAASLGKTDMIDCLVEVTLRHATVSIFVTSFTTSSAFFASMVNTLPALKCFAVFSGTAILINFFLLVPWISAVMVINKRYSSSISRIFSGCLVFGWVSKIKLVLDFLQNLMDVLREKLLASFRFLIFSLRHIWVVLFVLSIIGSIVVVFIHPRLRLPDKDVQAFLVTSHPVTQVISMIRGTMLKKNITNQ